MSNMLVLVSLGLLKYIFAHTSSRSLELTHIYIWRVNLRPPISWRINKFVPYEFHIASVSGAHCPLWRTRGRRNRAWIVLSWHKNL